MTSCATPPPATEMEKERLGSQSNATKRKLLPLVSSPSDKRIDERSPFELPWSWTRQHVQVWSLHFSLSYTTEQNVSFRKNLGHVCAWSVFLASSPLATRLVGMFVIKNVGPFHVRRTARIVWRATGQSVASRTREHLPPFGGLRFPLLRHVEFWYPLWPCFTQRGRPTSRFERMLKPCG